MGLARDNRLPDNMHRRGLLRRHVWRGRGNSEGTADARHGRPPEGFQCQQRVHDIFHLLHCHDVLCGVWFTGYGICGDMFDAGLCGHVGGSDWTVLFDGEVSTEFVHCLFDWRDCAVECVLDDDSEFVEYGRFGRSKAPVRTLYGKATVIEIATLIGVNRYIGAEYRVLGLSR